MYSPVLQFLGFNTSSTGRLLRNRYLLPVLAVSAVFLSAFKINAQNINNVFYGHGAGSAITTGFQNTAIGWYALSENTTGSLNMASGDYALTNNVRGNENTANGSQALFFNEGGGGNTATGSHSLLYNKSGSFNIANGYRALYHNVTGFWNIATGYQALQNNQSGSFNIALGVNAGSAITGSSNIDIGNVGVANDSGKIRIGTKGTHDGTFIAGISGIAVNGTQVVVNSNGKLGVAASSARFKKAIKPMDKTSEALHQLQPVTFYYKGDIDPNGIPQFGLVAEQVEKVDPNLVVRDEEGEVMTVRYEAVNAMLLNEFLKEHRNVAEQQSTIAELNTTIAQQQKQIEALTTAVRKVSERVELSAPAPQIVANDD
jgi:uncharacterized coiled-coil protein SlyX